jgi:hypothetical protein
VSAGAIEFDLRCRRRVDGGHRRGGEGRRLIGVPSSSGRSGRAVAGAGLAQFAGQAEQLGLQGGLLGAVLDQAALGVEEVVLGDGEVVEAAPAGLEVQLVGPGTAGPRHPLFEQGAICGLRCTGAGGR